ncbi:hypothetical protein [Bradyrhizobium sp. 145]|uniref:hypothetical protein n=1 Tax=Bradyrhizobium sp. 145 TaxID=2782621 RepID=UPI001FFA6E40|nr:hypothetical protein [Bradyrhizobium sp. 145]MCK1684667.1 hypothetical protein [Bradyrhizobium sp. 145]
MNIAIKLAAVCGVGALLVGMVAGSGKSAPPPPSVPLPYDQAGFVRSVSTAKTAFKSATNQLAAGGARNSRKQAICNILQGQSASGWIGKLAELTSNGDGKGVVSIELAPDVHVATWNNALSDIGSRTLIDPTSSLFKSLAGMKRGDFVRFSGSFTSSDVDCVREQSVTLDGSMTDPVFTMRFSSVAKL